MRWMPLILLMAWLSSRCNVNKHISKKCVLCPAKINRNNESHRKRAQSNESNVENDFWIPIVCLVVWPFGQINWENWIWICYDGCGDGYGTDTLRIRSIAMEINSVAIEFGTEQMYYAINATQFLWIQYFCFAKCWRQLPLVAYR